jgi:hypothetical protein
MSTLGRKSVYIAGALTDMSSDKRELLRRFYESLADICREFGLEPYLPHQHADPETIKDLTPHRVDQLDRLAVTQAYLVVAYVGITSVGVGIEIEIAHHANKPVVILAEKSRLDSRHVSRLVRGNPAVMAEIAFDDFEDAKFKLHGFLQTFHEAMSAQELPRPLRIEL